MGRASVATAFTRRTCLLLGGAAVGATVATHYHLSAHEPDGGDRMFLPTATWRDMVEYLRLPMERRRRMLWVHLFSRETGADHSSSSGEGVTSRHGDAHASTHPSPLVHAQTGAAVVDGGSALTKSSYRAVPTSAKERFLLYARPHPVTGEPVQQLEDFVACMLLLEPFSIAQDEPPPQQQQQQRLGDAAHRAPGRTAMTALPPLVQERVTRLFSLVDMDRSRSISYAEFTVLLTLLSTRRRLLRTAFAVFHGEGRPNRVDEVEFTRILNTLMVDPAVRIVDGATPMVRAATRGGDSGGQQLSHTIPSAAVWELFQRPLPRHEMAPPGSRHASGVVSGGGGARERHLASLAEEDRRLNLLSFDTFWYRMDFLRWELRAIEFGISDPANTGFIALRDFRAILSHNLHQTLSARRKTRQGHRREGGGPATAGADDAHVISWQFYQTVFDIIRESEKTLPALRLALDAQPAVLAGELVEGAIPDAFMAGAHAATRALVVQRQSGDPLAVSAAKTQQAERVRPTALTWKQFGQVLRACDGVPTLTAQEEQLFFELFDADRSGTITPGEFAMLCELRRSFFAHYLPRFTEPRRNTIQQFFYCMQQLE